MHDLVGGQRPIWRFSPESAGEPCTIFEQDDIVYLIEYNIQEQVYESARVMRMRIITTHGAARAIIHGHDCILEPRTAQQGLL